MYPDRSRRRLASLIFSFCGPVRHSEGKMRSWIEYILLTDLPIHPYSCVHCVLASTIRCCKYPAWIDHQDLNIPCRERCRLKIRLNVSDVCLHGASQGWHARARARRLTNQRQSIAGGKLFTSRSAHHKIAIVSFVAGGGSIRIPG